MTARQPCRIRLAREEDLLRLLQVYARSDEGLNPVVIAASPEEERTWREMLASASLSVYLATVEGQIAGTALLQRMPTLGYRCRPVAFVEAMVVSAAHRRTGIARQLIMHILQDAKDSGCHKIQVVTHKRHADDGAHEFYRSVGFEAEAEGFRRYLGER